MLDSVPNTLPYATLALFAVGVLLLLVSLRLFKRSRTDTFWRRRREAGQRGWRLFVSAFVLFAAGGFACLFTLAMTLFDDGTSSRTPTTLAGNLTVPTATLDPSLSATLEMVAVADELTPSTETRSDASPVPADPGDGQSAPEVVIVTATPAFTPTVTPFPTYTPQVTPLVSDVTPLPNAQITITALDSQISDTLAPINPRTEFDTGTKRIYFFVEFSGMAEGVAWQRHLYRDGVWIDGGVYLWGLETQGTSYFFFGSDAGLEPGSYEIHLSIGGDTTPVAVAAFTVRDPTG